MNDIVPDENNEAFVVDLTRYTEGIFTEQDVRKRYRLDETQNKLAAIAARKLARIMHDGEELNDGCSKKRAIHVASRCLSELRFGSALRHSRHERRYAASL